MRTSSRYLEDSGAGTVVALALMGAVSSLAVVMFSVSATVVQQVRLDALADNAAIAAADALRGLVAGYPCDIARELAPITSCVVMGNDVLIEVLQGGLSSKARAGEPG